jgi:5-methylcytosine-specific restriction endonuclease McrBC regulatory subunit McrC
MIRLTDNTTAPESLSAEALAALIPYAGVSLTRLVQAHPGLLVFPDHLGYHYDNWQDEPLYRLVGGKLKPGNVVGFFSVNGEQIQIRSRFDSDTSKQYFLHYLLTRVLGINVLNLPTTSDREPLWDFLLYLFPCVLKKALRQGILRQYHFFQYNDSHVRGAIDIARHLRLNVPFNGRIAYQTRELTANNPVIQLVRHTIEAIRINPRAGNILMQDAEMRQAVQTITRLTPNYCRQDLALVIAQNLRPIRHPYFTEYAVLQQLCLQILRHEKISYGDADDERQIYGIVFKAEWLWEEYLAPLLKPLRILHASNTGHYSPVKIYTYRGDKRPVWIDFFDDTTIFDAKYKRLEDGYISREDLYQLISYMHIREARGGYLLYPDNSQSVAHTYIAGDLNGYGGRVGKIAFPIPQSANYASFAEYQKQMEHSEASFVARVKEIIS